MTRLEEVCRELKQRPRRWLITGVAGFIGSNLLETLLRLDQRVIGLDNFANGFAYNLDDVRSGVSGEQWSRFRLIEGDVRDSRLCTRAVDNVDCVLHQAALGSVVESMDDPWNYHDANVSGHLRLLLAAREARVPRIVYAASSAVYGDDPALRKTEAAVGRALSPYAVTKYVNELYADIFARSYGLSIVGLRYFNVFGRRQNPRGGYTAVIPTWFSALRREMTVQIYGDGETSRDFCYIDNVVQANLLAATVEDFGAPHDIFNIAVGQQTTLNRLFMLIRDQVASQHPAVAGLRPKYHAFRPGDIRHSQASIAKAVEILGYEPSHTVEDGIAATTPWYLASDCPALQEDEVLLTSS